MSKHVHADLIMEYAKIAQVTETPWEHFEVQCGTKWHPCVNPIAFKSTAVYRLKPKTKIILGKEYVCAETDAPKYGTKYFLLLRGSDGGVGSYTWCGDDIDNKILKSGRLFLSYEDAVAADTLVQELFKPDTEVKNKPDTEVKNYPSESCLEAYAELHME